ncbi:MAG: transcription-repair coupling factor, partial [Proteobacteria bacterium]|nr:transcription-repair coupling factor [Burkholderiales bacterium]
PVRVEVLSRFKSPKESKDLLARVAEGRVDILIGTHRLLQADVKFKDLGLVIVDEEQRFGVRQKEALKKLRAEVHLLTMTATPIPRTLNMAMAGLRDLSIIATPPANRLAVQTFVTQWDPALLREAFQRELARGGQVYFLHNEVTSIERIAKELEVLVPEARIRFAHGQMPERELEHVMLDFYRQRFNVLVCTTIIESGIDIPSANTIIIDRADRFGLSQLHQLRGRVGRSHHQAYAYLLTHDEAPVSADARKRLDAIQMMEELGSGFYLAMHDLEIRGAGEVLGDNQSGEMQEIGFGMYTEMLASAVRSLRAGREPDLDAPLSATTEINLHATAVLPDTYCADVHERLVLYKRLANCDSVDELDALAEELVDRFGVLPDSARTLVETHRLRLLSRPLGVLRIDAGAHAIQIQFVPNPPIDPQRVLALVRSRPGHRLVGSEKLRIDVTLATTAERVELLRRTLQALASGSTPALGNEAGASAARVLEKPSANPAGQSTEGARARSIVRLPGSASRSASSAVPRSRRAGTR